MKPPFRVEVQQRDTSYDQPTAGMQRLPSCLTVTIYHLIEGEYLPALIVECDAFDNGHIQSTASAEQEFWSVGQPNVVVTQPISLLIQREDEANAAYWAEEEE